LLLRQKNISRNFWHFLLLLCFPQVDLVKKTWELNETKLIHQQLNIKCSSFNPTYSFSHFAMQALSSPSIFFFFYIYIYIYIYIFIFSIPTKTQFIALKIWPSEVLNTSSNGHVIIAFRLQKTEVINWSSEELFSYICYDELETVVGAVK
jgi:hypothetical protein